MNMKKKINFTYPYKGTQLKFKNINVSVGKYGASTAMMGVSQVVRQFVKQVFPQVGKFWISTDSYSMGDSVTVYLNRVDRDLFNEVHESLQHLFQYGTWNGMEDCYDMKDFDAGIKAEVDGKEVLFDTKYYFTENRPKYGTPEFKEEQKLL